MLSYIQKEIQLFHFTNEWAKIQKTELWEVCMKVLISKGNRIAHPHITIFQSLEYLWQIISLDLAMENYF